MRKTKILENKSSPYVAYPLLDFGDHMLVPIQYGCVLRLCPLTAISQPEPLYLSSTFAFNFSFDY